MSGIPLSGSGSTPFSYSNCIALSYSISDIEKDINYKIKHGNNAFFEGLIRKDPVDKNEIVLAASYIRLEFQKYKARLSLNQVLIHDYFVNLFTFP